MVAVARLIITATPVVAASLLVWAEIWVYVPTPRLPSLVNVSLWPMSTSLSRVASSSESTFDPSAIIPPVVSVTRSAAERPLVASIAIPPGLATGFVPEVIWTELPRLTEALLPVAAPLS